MRIATVRSARAVARLDALAGRTIGERDELVWVWRPERTLPAGASEPQAEDLDAFWDATAFAVDLVLDDGSRLSALPVLDQYGVAPTPDAQFAARASWVDQANRRAVALDGLAGRRVVRAEAVLGREAADAPGAADASHPAAASAALRVAGVLEHVAIDPRPPRPATPLEAVRTTRGSNSSGDFSRGNAAPLVAAPHGGVFGLPMTDAGDARWPYSYGSPAIQAFATSHLPSPWMGDRGVFQLMPSPSERPAEGRSERALAFDRADERDGPHRYEVRLTSDEGDVVATMTAARFALGFRFRFETGRERAAIVLDHHGLVREARITRDGAATVVEALLDDRPGTPVHYLHVRVAGVVADRTTFRGGLLRGHLVVSTEPPVDVLLGISTLSYADAAANVADAGGFDDMLATAEREWTERLGTLVVDGATDDQLVSLYSGLYRLFLYPMRAGEHALTGAPRHPVLAAGTVAAGELSTTNGFWDTYRTAWPLLALLTPRAAGELAQGFVQHFLDSGWTPRWSAPGPENVMTGTTSDVVFADLLVKGVPGLDLEQAYRSAVRNATTPSPDVRTGRTGIHPGVFRGYVDTSTPEGLSWTLDAAIADWGLAAMARLLLDRTEPGTRAAERLAAEAEWFARRSLHYRSVFHPELGFFVGREPGGDWRATVDEFDPDEWGYDYTETNAWGTMFTVPHDGAGLVALHGGDDGLRAALDRFFERRETAASRNRGSYPHVIHEMTEARDIRAGMLGMSNQPAHHIPFVPMFAGDHDRAHAIVRDSLRRLFVGSDLGQGYPGDEDNGEMSAWYVLCTIGLYPLAPATGSYVLVPPSVRRAELRPPGGAVTVMEVVAGAGDHIASVRVNGEAWHSVAIGHDVIAAGAHIEFELAERPTGWARDSRPVSASALHGHASGAHDLLPVGAHPLTDDTGETVVMMDTGDRVDLATEVADGTAASLLTVTAAEPGTFSWRVEWVAADGTTVRAGRYWEERFDWPGQTRVFRVNGMIAAVLRLTAESTCRFTQLELIAASESAPPAVQNHPATRGTTAVR